MASPTKRKSPDADRDAYPSDDARTPTDAPPHKKLRITRSQKQALIDNLQLESMVFSTFWMRHVLTQGTVTERARKLRAQYALQAHDLRSRIERRINRIPVALRKAKMGELLEKHNNSLRMQQTALSPKKHASPGKGTRNLTSASVKRGKQSVSTASPSTRRLKRQSHEGLYSDKENAPAAGDSLDVLKNPKRRANPAGTSRVVSQEPLKSTSASAAGNADNARSRTTKANTTSTRDMRPPSQAKRPASRAAATTKTVRSPFSRPATQLDRRGSISSTASSGTTVIKPGRAGAGTRKATTASSASAPVKRTTIARNQAPSVAAKRSTASATRKATAPAGGEASATGRRVLRKRA
ncbi:uncharacterized protein P174DRAFT_427542 [Aspergillus novofumigatus IBT 16806]|uniref:Borealin N-terminal domain-containing protein n=1 Tax=Aspergillus novofumigatus (strain IBT 16806) TaxID=1392255 RepID=A0A2I1CNX8_ASPN1|nr:uncharacterized protein P174DRAFT_427542 [Aspergillus novofumigatus IBT 16806]PKX99334.1 hypothetical protein P174DRAFT_427542 [Aspergillus novofumigatus IBT 16806]